MNVIELRGVTVRFRRRKVRSVKDALVHGFSFERKADYLYSLRDVSLTVRNGESVGLIGSNGAGKSTLLRVAASIIPPSAGLAVTRGKIAPVIALGTGFESEMSGRENIFFNGALLGLSRAYMRSRADEIIAFSGIEEFIDAPLRTYSTGMVARLAFAVATSIEAATVLLDELLSVGDAEFRKRCDERIGQFVRNGTTMVVVSHDLDEVRKICQRVVWLADGRVAADGPAAEVIAEYERAVASLESKRAGDGR